MDDAEITFPDRIYAVEDRGEQYALGKDPRRHEGDVAELAGGDGMEPREHLPED